MGALPYFIISMSQSLCFYRAVSKGSAYFAITASKKLYALKTGVRELVSVQRLRNTGKNMQENNNCSWQKTSLRKGRFCTYIKPVIEQPVRKLPMSAQRSRPILVGGCRRRALAGSIYRGTTSISLKKCSGRMNISPEKAKIKMYIQHSAEAGNQQGRNQEEADGERLSKEQVDKLFNDMEIILFHLVEQKCLNRVLFT